MNCNDYLPLLSGHLDGENSPEEEQRLIQIFFSCRRIWRSVQTAAHGCRPSNAGTVCCGQTPPSRPPG